MASEVHASPGVNRHGEVHASPGVDRHGEPWFEDGNIVLITREEPIAFRVHRGVLARHSEVFQGMFQIPQRASDCEMYEGCQVVRMHDIPSELSNLITALYDGPSFANTGIKDFLYLAGILRLSTKYFIHHLRIQATRYLTKTWARTLHGHDDMVRTALTAPMVDNLTYPYAHPLHVLNLAREVNIQIVIPSALYFLSLYPLTDLIRADHPKLVKHPSSPSPEMLPHDLQNYTLMFQHRLNIILHFVRHICGERRASASCSNEQSCPRAFALLASRLSRSWQIRTGPFHYMTQAIEEISRDSTVCNACSQAFHLDVHTFRQKAWDELPSVIGLPSWEEMEAADTS
ncbi:hypothetical protein BDN72DRAFT_870349 [Pluteus cervinus]|uniref:Uncharacterized protein n=1 Tax=Pluteus cervinus TaxID=181527 RepID=A0ACD3AXI0_9AGAR|nr:hypothetical protein BDN72DRAFT_870349 [Pluteus cervinus]